MTTTAAAATSTAFTPPSTATTNKTNDKNNPRMIDDDDDDDDLAVWSTNTTCSFTGQVLSLDGSLGYDGLELFQDAHVALERGCIYGLVAPNGSGKTSLVRALPKLPGFPANFRVEYLAADMDSLLLAAAKSKKEQEVLMTASARDYCLSRVALRVQQLEQTIDEMEASLEHTTEEEEMEQLSNLLGELYETKDDIEQEATTLLEQMFADLQFGEYYPNQAFGTLSSGWKYKCQLVSTLLTRPDLMIIDEPSFLDTQATAWLVSQLQTLSKSHNTMIVLISHKEALLEELCDRILYLNPASRTLTVYHCGFLDFQAAHADRVASAQKSKDQAEAVQQQAQQSLGQIRQQLRKREQTYKAKNSEYGQASNNGYLRGKCKEAKQHADHSAAAKLKRTQQQVKVQEEKHALLLQAKVAPLELQGTLAATDRPLVELVDVDFQYEGSRDMMLLEYVNCQIAGTDKILVQGANGQGKSTLAKMILGELQPTNGDVRRSTNTIAHFHQDALADLIRQYGHKTPVDFLQTRDQHLTVLDARTYLGRFGLKGNVAVREIRTLSAGQRVRLWLSREFYETKPALLILDEVTENLDSETTDSLLESMEGFSAAVLAISHDDYFCEKYPATQVWSVGYGRVRVEYK